MKLDEITICGYKSIRELRNFKLRNLNVLIGANGSGKSNFISVFRLLAEVANGNLQYFVTKQGGPDTFLQGTRKRTPTMLLAFSFGKAIYQIELEATAADQLMFKKEEFTFFGNEGQKLESLGQGHVETKLFKEQEFVIRSAKESYVYSSLQSWRSYHFHDTSENAAVKLPHGKDDNLRLKPDAGNLAAYLFMLKEQHSSAYQRIIQTIQLVAPFFGDFVFRYFLPDKARIEWTERGNIDTPYSAHALSDGTLRFICLATLLLQPIELLPDTVLIDEPELGLHPYAINILANMIKRVAEEKQLIISTQSVELLNEFEPADVIVVEREPNVSNLPPYSVPFVPGLAQEEYGSIFKRLDTEQLKNWLEDYALGELWKSNVLGGGPLR